MSDAFWMAFFAFLTALVGATVTILGTVLSWLNRQKLQTVQHKVEEVKKAANSLTDQLVAKTELEAHARGVKEEKDRQEKNGAK